MPKIELIHGDCFMGSGTTGLACKNQNRNFLGIEIDLKYFKIAEQRILHVPLPAIQRQVHNRLFDYLGL